MAKCLYLESAGELVSTAKMISGLRLRQISQKNRQRSLWLRLRFFCSSSSSRLRSHFFVTKPISRQTLLIVCTLLVCAFSMTASALSAGGGAIKIALVAGFTGVADIPSYHLLSAVKMEVDNINKRGGINGKLIEIVTYDDESNPVKTVSIANNPRLDEVVGIIGFPWSQFILAAGPILQSRGIPSISILATHDRVTEIGDFVFRVCFTDSYQGVKLAQYARNKIGSNKALLFVNQQNSYSINLATILKKEFERLGGKIVAEIDYIPQEKSDYFTDKLVSIDKGSYDSVFMPDDQVYVMPIMEAFNSIGASDKIYYGGDGWNMANISIKNRHLEDFEIYVIGHWNKDESEINNKTFIEEFRKLYPSEPQDATALSHDALYVLLDAVKSVPSLDKTKIKDRLRQTDYKGLTGRIQFKTNGDPIHKPLVIHKVHKGTRKSTVYE